MRRAPYPRPRWQTPLPDGVAGSWGPDVAAWAERELRIVLDRWQRRALNRALVYGADGRLLHRIYLISTARQNGKTALVRALIGWALTALDTPEWRYILGVAHDRAQARIPYSAVLADLAPMARRLGPTARGGLALTRYLGIRSAMYGRHREYHVASREAANAIRGLSVDLAPFDEIRTQVTEDVWAALEPTTTARPEALVLGISTAGNDRSVILRTWWERGRRIIEGAEPAAGFGMTWYAAPDDLAPDDPRAWRAANPSIADGRITEQVIAESMRSVGPATFRMERLNLWADAADEWLPPGLWAATAAPQPDPVPAGARIVLGVDVVPTWRRASVAVAIALPDRTWVGVAGELVAGRTLAAAVSPADLVGLVDRLAAAWKPSAIAWSASAAAHPHLEAWAQVTRRPPVRPIAMTTRHVKGASELLRSELVGGRLAHPDDPLLAQQSRAARPSAPIEGGDWYLAVRAATGDVDALRACAWAAWAAIAPPDPDPTPVQVFL